MFFSDIGDLFLVILSGALCLLDDTGLFIPAPERMSSPLPPLGGYFWCLPIRQDVAIHLQSLHVSDI